MFRFFLSVCAVALLVALSYQASATSVLRQSSVSLQSFITYTDTAKTDSSRNVKEAQEPAPDDFIPVEREPIVDLNALAQRVIYPDYAKQEGIEGRVTLRVLIDTTGKPIKYRIDDSNNEYLNKAAIDAVMGSSYIPAIQKGKTVACWVSIPITFKLR